MGFHHILLVDDDQDDREIFQSAVDIVGSLKCSQAASAIEALRMLTSGEVTPDVIFLDLNMPLMTGHEFLAKIKAIPHLRHLPVIIFSTSGNQQSVQLAKGLGAYDYITKPYKFEELVTVLKRVL
ncbi:MAG: response regulator [Flavobacterium sp.]|nr:MAG: response regulator [Flavobacterium sp.]